MKQLRTIFEQYHTHNGVKDVDQVSVVLNSSKRLMVEAPAGYGKTKTMVSRIALLILGSQIPNAKHVLALTFSVNAAYKIRREILEELKQVIADRVALDSINRRVDTSNYHGFCRRLLGLYGYLLAPQLANIGQFKNIDESKPVELEDLPFALEKDEKLLLIQFARTLKDFGKPGASIEETTELLMKSQATYLQLLLSKFIPNQFITYNGILLITQLLFEKYSQIKEFYNAYYAAIFIDEFQDTNWLQWRLLKEIIGPEAATSGNRNIYLFGDPVQRIYGFIGAIPKIFDYAQKEFSMDIVALKTNHRFGTDTTLGKLDRVLRANAENVRFPNHDLLVEIPIVCVENQEQEATYVFNQINNLQKARPNATIAILVRAGMVSKNTQAIYNRLRTGKINFFYALFSDEDNDYIEFHKNCLDAWLKELKEGNIRNLKSAQIFINQFGGSLPPSETNDSLIKLLKYHISKVQDEYGFLTFEQKSHIIADTLANRALKQHLNLIKDSAVVLATTHGSKGLEWDYVIIPDLERYSFPSFLCFYNDECKTHGCPIDWKDRSPNFEAEFLDELSVFYVAVTRSKNDVYISFSSNSISRKGNEYPTRLSCLAQLPGIKTKIV